jgi:hypothetical protein
VGGLIFLSFHFWQLVKYQTNLINGDTTVTFSKKYSYPFFHQDWRLFAAPPRQSFEVWVIHNLKWYKVNELHVNKKLDETLKLGTYNSLFYVVQNLEASDSLQTIPESTAKLITAQWLNRLWKGSHEYKAGNKVFCLIVKSIEDRKKCSYYFL